MHISSYPKVYSIGHAAVQDLFTDPVLVEEKIDGSQFSFCLKDGELSFRSRGAEIHGGAPEKMFAPAVETVKTLADALHEGWVYRAEYLGKPKHNVLTYGRTPNKNMILFDINTGDELYLPKAEKDVEASRLGLEAVPQLFIGKISSPDELLALLEIKSCLGGTKVEGVVAKNYLRFGKDKKVLMGKYVREDFKEVHAREWKAANPAMGDVIDRLIATLRNENRWEKALQHLREAGRLESSPRDIGPLIQEVQKDIREEEAEFIKEKLAEYAMGRIIRAAAAGVAEWYKRKLLDKQFSEKEALTE